jgi:CDP-4-dehydro-6-deoxyglucose reductase
MSKQTLARLDSITPLTDSIIQLILVPEEYIDYQAGQYLQILSGKEAFSYSIANAPLGSRKYELHIRHSRDNSNVQQLLADIKANGFVSIRLPLGQCDLQHLNPQKPILFIAGGTGFAPIKAMIEQLLVSDRSVAFELFWGARSQSDLYMDEKVLHWQKHIPHFHYFSQLSQENRATANLTATFRGLSAESMEHPTLASNVLARHPHDMNIWQMVISGPFDMVYKTRDELVAHGVPLEHLFSDAFEMERK